MTLHFLYTINHNYVLPACVSILSLIENNKEENLHLHIITDSFTLDDFLALDNFMRLDKRVHITYYRLEDYSIEKYNIPNWRKSQIANARLFFQDIIKTDSIDKLAYLDADTIITRDLKDLFSYEGAINAVLQTPFKSYLERLGLNRYFNSGVLLFDVEKWIKEDFQRKIIDFKRRNKEMKLTWPDQDLLNFSIGESISELPIIYNVFPCALLEKFHYNERFYKDARKANRIENINEVVENAAIYHSTGMLDIKPWYQNKINPLNEDFLKYAKRIDENFTPEKLEGIKGFLANQPTLFYLLLYVKNICLPENRKDFNSLKKQFHRK